MYGLLYYKENVGAFQSFYSSKHHSPDFSPKILVILFFAPSLTQCSRQQKLKEFVCLCFLYVTWIVVWESSELKLIKQALWVGFLGSHQKSQNKQPQLLVDKVCFAFSITATYSGNVGYSVPLLRLGAADTAQRSRKHHKGHLSTEIEVGLYYVNKKKFYV